MVRSGAKSARPTRRADIPEEAQARALAVPELVDVACRFALLRKRPSVVYLLGAGDLAERRPDVPITARSIEQLEDALDDDRFDDIDVVIQSSGGDIHAAYQLISLLQGRRNQGGRIVACVPRWARSSATLLCLGADEIQLGELGALSPLDAQIRKGVTDAGTPDYISALHLLKGLYRLQQFGIDTFKEISGALYESQVIREDVLEYGVKFSAALTAPLLNRIDAEKAGQWDQLLQTGEEYGRRLLANTGLIGRNLHLDTDAHVRDIVHRLVYEYQSHELVLDVDHLVHDLDLRAGLIDVSSRALVRQFVSHASETLIMLVYPPGLRRFEAIDAADVTSAEWPLIGTRLGTQRISWRTPDGVYHMRIARYCPTIASGNPFTQRVIGGGSGGPATQFSTGVPGYAADEPATGAPAEPGSTPDRTTTGDGRSAPGPLEQRTPQPGPFAPRSPAPDRPAALLGGGEQSQQQGLVASEAGGRSPRDRRPEAGGTPTDERVLQGEVEDHPRDEPLRLGEQYTVAFSVGPESLNAVVTDSQRYADIERRFSDRDVVELDIHVDSEDFSILSDATRRLRVPRGGNSQGKARFDIAPQHSGRCTLTASVFVERNFVSQMKLSMPVGSDVDAPVETVLKSRPFASLQNLRPRDIALEIERSDRGSTYRCRIADGGIFTTWIPITPEELDAAVNAARDALMTVIRMSYPPVTGSRVFLDGVDVPEGATDAALPILAKAGARLFRLLFDAPGAAQDIQSVGRALKEAAANPDVLLKLQITATEAPLPWGLIYVGDVKEGAELDWNHFLGMRHVIEQLPLEKALHSLIDNEIGSEPQLSVSLNVNQHIDQQHHTHDVSEHQRRWMELAARLGRVVVIQRPTEAEVMQALTSPDTPDQIAYFYCHAFGGDGKDPKTAWIALEDQPGLTLLHLEEEGSNDVPLAGRPLVFINACESADLSPRFYDGFVPYFMGKGARGVVGTECRTPIVFAIAFANEFFDRFLGGASIGRALLDTRRSFLTEHGNPLGLIYAAHADADTIISPALIRQDG